MPGRTGQAVILAKRVIMETEILIRIGDPSGEGIADPGGHAQFDAEMPGFIGIHGAQRNAGRVAQIQQLLFDPRIIDHRIGHDRCQMAAPAKFHGR